LKNIEFETTLTTLKSQERQDSEKFEYKEGIMVNGIIQDQKD
jgi:hypothetical protein